MQETQETQSHSLGWEDLLEEEEMATRSSILAWKIPWTEEPGGPQFMGSQRVRHDEATSYTRPGGTEQWGCVLEAGGGKKLSVLTVRGKTLLRYKKSERGSPGGPEAKTLELSMLPPWV